MYTCSLSLPFRYAPFTSICWTNNFFVGAMASITLMVSRCTTGECVSTLLRSWALPLIFSHFPPFYSALSVTHSPLVLLRAAQTATKSPDKSPDGSPDHSAVDYHMPSLCSPQHSAASPFNPLWIASSLPRHDGPPAHDGAILRTASS